MAAEWQIKRAPELLAPKPRQCDACRDDVLAAIKRIDAAKVRDKTKPLTPTQYRRQLQRLAKALAAAVSEAVKVVPVGQTTFPDHAMLADLIQHLNDTDLAIRNLNKHARKGGWRTSAARRTAVRESFLLLAKYNMRPERGYAARWHALALALLGYKAGNLRPYLRRYWSLERLVDCHHAYKF